MTTHSPSCHSDAEPFGFPQGKLREAEESRCFGYSAKHPEGNDE